MFWILEILFYIIPIQFIELITMFTRGLTFYFLPIQFIVFILLALGIRDYLAYRSKPVKYSDIDPPVSVIIPTYKENPEILRKCVTTVLKNNPLEIILIHDDGRADVERIASELVGVTVISFEKRIGKRLALVEGWRRAKCDIIVQVDSDEIVEEGCFEELIKPLQNSDVVGVQGRNIAYPCGSQIAYHLTILQELNRDLTCKAVRPTMVDVDGRINAWRKDFLVRHIEDFSNEMFLGRRSEIGDDRYLTHIANLEGKKTTYQESAVAYTASPTSLRDYVKQQLRWTRSGYKFFFLEIKDGLKNVTKFYYPSQVFFYLSAIFFTIAILHDTFLVPPIYSFPPWSIVPVIAIGSTIISLIGVAFSGYFSGFNNSLEFLKFGVIGIFIMYPIMLYGLLTVRKQATWGTRI